MVKLTNTCKSLENDLSQKSMISVRLTLEDRRIKQDGTCPIKIAITKQSKVAYIPTEYSVSPLHWDKKEQAVIVRHDRMYLNNNLSKLKFDIQEALVELSKKYNLKTKTAVEIKNMVVDFMNPEKHSFLVVDAFKQVIETRAAKGTKAIYQRTLEKIETYAPTLTFEEITLKWLVDFENWLSQTMCKNGRNIHLKNLRAVFTYALDNELTEAKYPFRKFKIKSQETIKRALTVEELRTIINYPCEECQEQYRDMFLLTFYLIGINMVDMYGLTEVKSNGRIDYYRAKTHKLYSIKVEPEAMDIINKYRGEKHLLAWADRYQSHLEFMHKTNRNLKQIGEVRRVGRGGKKVYTPLFPQITTYWARFTWATLAAELDIPKETISAALGHEIGSRITSIYIRFDQKKVDAANRKVIDYVLQKGEYAPNADE